MNVMDLRNRFGVRPSSIPSGEWAYREADVLCLVSGIEDALDVASAALGRRGDCIAAIRAVLVAAGYKSDGDVTQLPKLVAEALAASQSRTAQPAPAGWRFQRNADGSIGIFGPPPRPDEAQRTSESVPAASRGLNQLLGRLADQQAAAACDWLHLKRFGYAPGNYMSRCRRCGNSSTMDKRAVTCRPCATAMHAESQGGERIESTFLKDSYQ